MNLTFSTASRKTWKLLKATVVMIASVVVWVLRFVLEVVLIFGPSSRGRGSSSSGGDDG
ncbi:hypothetical protein [Streptomyces sp. NBC_00286]|uniref:hypothetical protein n=1 Tax=Streptomyces sp. NBC_00286 TaxID=2975701 RepID=UPI002E2E16A3|nr:hypothetical protein [Streptomyces sp. NBC_00286]